MSDHEDHGPDDIPEPIDLDGYRKYPDRSKEPIRDGYRLDGKVLIGPDGNARCSAKARNAPGGVCHSYKIRNQARCRIHGGSTQRGKEKAAYAKVERQMRAYLEQFDIGPIHDPLTALKTLAGEVVAWKDAMRAKVEEMDRLHVSTEYGETAKAVVQLFERAMDRASDVLFKIAKLNIDERLAAVTEHQAQMIEEGFFAALEEVGIPLLDLDTREKVAVAYAKHLSVIPA